MDNHIIRMAHGHCYHHNCNIGSMKSIFFFKNIIMTLELCMTSLYKVNQKENIGLQYFVPQFGRGRLWLVEKKWRVHMKVTNISCEFKYVYLVLMLPKNFGDCLPKLENILSNNSIGNSCCMLIFVIV